MENRHGLTLQLAYTYSHALDDVSNDLNRVSNPFNIRYDYGSGALDRRHIFNANYIYDLPILRARRKRWRHAAVPWRLADLRRNVCPIGNPARHTQLHWPDMLGLGGGTTNRPNLVAKVSYPKKRTAVV